MEIAITVKQRRRVVACGVEIYWMEKLFIFILFLFFFFFFREKKYEMSRFNCLLVILVVLSFYL